MNEEITRNIRKQLSKKEQVILADFWESDIRGVIEKAFGLRQLQIAQLVLKSSADHYHTREMRGRANELMEMTQMLSDNLKKTNNERQKSQ